jgi:hypothetical protein
MLQAQQVEELICLVSVLDRSTLIRQFGEFPARFPVDFTPSFLESLPVDRVRHLFLALCLQCQHLPRLDAGAAAA